MEGSEKINSESAEVRSTFLFPATVKQTHRQVFYLPESGRWDVGTSLTEAYYETGKSLIEGVIPGSYMESIEGLVGVFLFRHYLELQVKYALFHARWLKSWNENERDENIEGIKNIHLIDDLWKDLKTACSARIPDETWKAWDIAFVDQCIDEFHSVDPKSFRFRYRTGKIAVAPRSEPYSDPMNIDFDALLRNMTHVHDIFEAIDSYLIESHRENEEWQSILNSF